MVGLDLTAAFLDEMAFDPDSIDATMQDLGNSSRPAVARGNPLVEGGTQSPNSEAMDAATHGTELAPTQAAESFPYGKPASARTIVLSKESLVTGCTPTISPHIRELT